MKRVFTLCLISFFAASTMAQVAAVMLPTFVKMKREAGMDVSQETEYVDLGLPSGTLWKNVNEGGDYAHYTHDEAVSRFGNNLPSKQQFEELKNKCRWTWIGNGYKVTGPNENFITFPAAGSTFYGDEEVYGVGVSGKYFSSTPIDVDYIWHFYFTSNEINISEIPCRMYYQSVRLVK